MKQQRFLFRKTSLLIVLAAWGLGHSSPVLPASPTPGELAAGEVPVVPVLSAPTIADREPYSRWTTHTGTASEAVVHVRVTLQDYLTGETQIREGNGFVVRCDGFVLVPTELLLPKIQLASGETRRVNLKDKTTRLVFAAGDGGVPPAQNVPHPRFFYENVPFALVKTNDHHLKSVPLLAADGVKTEMLVQVVYAKPKHGEPDQVEAVVTEAIVSQGEQDKTLFSLRALAHPVPAGALVVDRASGFAVGIVVGAPQTKNGPAAVTTFATFAKLHQISNAVGLLPTPDAASKSRRTEGMVWVPGGPLALARSLTQEYAALYGKWIACTPGFWIDKREVTNAEYRQFLLDTGHRPLPLGWDEAELNTSLARWRRSPDFPITGVSPPDAAAYAQAHQKRLVTPVEWAHASRGAGGAWLTEYQSALNEANATLNQALGAFARAEADQAILASAHVKRRGLDTGGIVVRNSEMQRIAEERHLFLASLVETFHRRFAYPLLVVRAGSRAHDVSVHGVRDVAMNVPELLLPNQAFRPVEVAPKMLAPQYHPDQMPQWADALLLETARRAGVSVQAPTGVGYLGAHTIRRSRMLGADAGRRIAGSLLPFPAADPGLDAGAFQAANLIGVGFRCAR